MKPSLMKINSLALIIMLSSLFFLGSCNRQNESSKGTGDRHLSQRSVQAETVTVKPDKTSEIRIFPATVRAKVQVTLASKLPGNVKKVFVDEGQRVKRDQLLLVVDDQEIKARIHSLEAAKSAVKDQQKAISARLSYAEANFRRFESLLSQEAATKEEFDRAKSEYIALKSQVAALSSKIKQIQAQIQEAENQLKYCRITSPIDGWVTARMVDYGTYVNPGAPLIRLDDSQKGFWLVAGVSEQLMAFVRPGIPVRIRIPAIGLDTESQIAQVIPKVDPSSRTFEVKVDLAGQQAKSGLFGRIAIPIGDRTCIQIPEKALVKRGVIDGVYVIDEDRIVHWRVIKARKGPRPGSIEVLSGLSPGDVIAISNLDQLEEGMRLE